tara:strand:- start:496 stop:1473 length:978 start_codon:yes stop_codon:yes gene_type:complete
MKNFNLKKYLKNNKLLQEVDLNFDGYEDSEETPEIEVLDDVEELEIEKDITININLEENYNKESLLKALGDADDAMIQLSDGREFVIYNPDSNNQDNADMWQSDVVFGVNQDGDEQEIEYSDISSINLEEKKLTAAEKDKKEDIIMGLKKQKGGKDKLTPADYAIATANAKRLAEFVGGEMEKRNEKLFSELVPGSGNADTIEGEILRAINRIVYRYYNDGDFFYRGYGTETAGPAHSFLINSNDIPFQLQSTLTSTFNKAIDAPEEGYERLIKFALEQILDYIEGKDGNYTKSNENMFDYPSEFEDEEDYDDDYYDEEDDDYYQ